MKLLLVRHPAPNIAPGICYGRLDLNLRDDTGAAVATIADAVRRHGSGAVWSSPATRCVVPARAAAAAARVRLVIDHRLQELDFGAWEGLPWADISRADLGRWAADPLGFAPPSGETGAELLARVRDAFRDIVAAGADCAVISHGGPLRVLLALARGEAPDLLATPPPYGAVLAVSYPPASCPPAS